MLMFPFPAKPDAASVASIAVLVALIDTLVSKGVVDKADVSRMFSGAVGDLGEGSEPAELVLKLAERVAKVSSYRSRA